MKNNNKNCFKKNLTVNVYHRTCIIRNQTNTIIGNPTNYYYRYILNLNGFYHKTLLNFKKKIR